MLFQTQKMKKLCYTFTNIYDVGNNEGAKPITPIDLSNFKMLEIDNRLCIYAGNTIWFSDLYNF